MNWGQSGMATLGSKLYPFHPGTENAHAGASRRRGLGETHHGTGAALVIASVRVQLPSSKEPFKRS